MCEARAKSVKDNSVNRKDQLKQNQTIGGGVLAKVKVTITTSMAKTGSGSGRRLDDFLISSAFWNV